MIKIEEFLLYFYVCDFNVKFHMTKLQNKNVIYTKFETSNIAQIV